MVKQYQCFESVLLVELHQDGPERSLTCVLEPCVTRLPSNSLAKKIMVGRMKREFPGQDDGKSRCVTHGWVCLEINSGQVEILRRIGR